MSVRSTEKFRARLAAAIAFSLAAFHLYTAGFGQLPDLMQRSMHVCCALALAFLLYPLFSDRSASKHPFFSILDLTLTALALFVAGYMLVRYDAMTSIDYEASSLDLWVGGLLIILLLDAARRVIGWFLPILSLILIAYTLFGSSIPGAFGHRGIGPDLMIEILFTTQRGIWGVVTGISATVIAVFVVFGAVLFACGGGKTFMDIALWISGRSTGGAAKVAVVASGLFGSLSGSAAANIATTGAFTIPMMVRLGYRRPFASAVEAVASSGGQLMPPIMGAGAFVMAELLGVPYASVAAAALMPALLFYGAVFLSIHLESGRLGYEPVPSDDIPQPREFLAPTNSLPLLVPLSLLIGLLVQGYTPTYAAFWAVVSAIGLFIVLRTFTRNHAGQFAELKNAFVHAGRGLVTVAVLIACAQIIVGLIAATGVGVKISGLIISVGGHSLALSMVLAMCLSIVLGMGLPTTAAYLLAATVVAPALAQLGVSDISAHLFIFYFAILAGLTPPVCGAVFIAAAIAQTPWTGTLSYTFRIATTAFLIPYLFVQHEALLMTGLNLEGLIRIAQAAMVIFALAVIGVGSFLGPIRPLRRACMFASALAIFIGTDPVALFGVVVLVGLFAAQTFAHHQSAKEQARVRSNSS